MILHICGNLASGKTTTVETLQPHLRWPVVSIGRIRNPVRRIAGVARGQPSLVWDLPDLTPGRSGIWVSTGLNWNEHRILALMPPRYLRRVPLTADPVILREAQRRRPNSAEYLPYPESWETLQDELMGYNDGTRPLPWPVDRGVDTGTTSVRVIVRRRFYVGHRREPGRDGEPHPGYRTDPGAALSFGQIG